MRFLKTLFGIFFEEEPPLAETYRCRSCGGKKSSGLMATIGRHNRGICIPCFNSGVTAQPLVYNDLED